MKLFLILFHASIFFTLTASLVGMKIHPTQYQIDVIDKSSFWIKYSTKNKGVTGSELTDVISNKTTILTLEKCQLPNNLDLRWLKNLNVLILSSCSGPALQKESLESCLCRSFISGFLKRPISPQIFFPKKLTTLIINSSEITSWNFLNGIYHPLKNLIICNPLTDIRVQKLSKRFPLIENIKLVSMSSSTGTEEASAIKTFTPDITYQRISETIILYRCSIETHSLDNKQEKTQLPFSEQELNEFVPFDDTLD